MIGGPDVAKASGAGPSSLVRHSALTGSWCASLAILVHFVSLLTFWGPTPIELYPVTFGVAVITGAPIALFAFLVSLTVSVLAGLWSSSLAVRNGCHCHRLGGH